MTTNRESVKRTVTNLEDRNNQLHKIAGMHEESVTAMRKELMECQTKLSTEEVDEEH